MQLNGITAVAISLGCIISTVMYFIKKFDAIMLKEELGRLRILYQQALDEAAINKEQVERLNTKLQEAAKKPSNDVLKILSDIKNGGALLHVEQIDKNDIYYHNGGQYR
jgi:hypothetical protein